MVLYIGSDHRGFQLKEQLKEWLKGEAYEVIDVGAVSHDPDDDYPLYAGKVGQQVSVAADKARGIVICGSGAGVDIVANKFNRVRSVLGISPDQVYESRRDDDVNVLAIASDFTKPEDAKKMVMVFLTTPLDRSEKHLRRLAQLNDIEDSQRAAETPAES